MAQKKKKKYDPRASWRKVARKIQGPIKPSRPHSTKKGKKGYNRKKSKKIENV